jgi:hypothetical protein
VLATGGVMVVLFVIEVRLLAQGRCAPPFERGDDAVALTLMRDPRSILVSRLEVVLGFSIVALMVSRPR